MDLGTQPLAVQLLGGAVTVLGGVIVVLWRTLQETRKDLDEWQQKHNAELKERARDSELFVRALGKRRSGSSDTPI